MDDTAWPRTAAKISHERDSLFRESPGATARRLALGVAWRLKPARIVGVPELLALHLKEWLRPRAGLPDPEATLTWAPDVAGVAHDLSVPTLVAAYSRGLHPVSHVLRPKWLSPPVRCVLFYPHFRLSTRQRTYIRKGMYRITFDRAFERVIKACADPRGGRWHLTWITPKIMRAFAELHDAGYAHSFEAWNADGDLVGGGYGVAVGGSFTLESMFCFESHSSKIGFTFLNWHLAHWGFHFTDMWEPAPYKRALGASALPRSDFLARLAEATEVPSRRGRWRIAAEPTTIAAWRPGEA